MRNHSGGYILVAGNPNTENVPGKQFDQARDTVAGIWYEHNGTDWRSKDGFRLGEILRYRVSLTQGGTNAPAVAVSYYNTTGSTVTPSYTNVGVFTLTFSGTPLTASHTRIVPYDQNNLKDKDITHVTNPSTSTIVLRTYSYTSTVETPTLANDLLGNTNPFILDVEIYPLS